MLYILIGLLLALFVVVVAVYRQLLHEEPLAGRNVATQNYDLYFLYIKILEAIPSKYLNVRIQEFILAQAGVCVDMLEQETENDDDNISLQYVKQLLAGKDRRDGLVQAILVDNYQAAGQVQRYLCELSAVIENTFLRGDLTANEYRWFQEEIRHQMIVVEFDVLLNIANINYAKNELELALKHYQLALRLCARISDDITSDVILNDMMARKNRIIEKLSSGPQKTQEDFAQEHPLLGNEEDSKLNDCSDASLLTSKNNRRI